MRMGSFVRLNMFSFYRVPLFSEDPGVVISCLLACCIVLFVSDVLKFATIIMQLCSNGVVFVNTSKYVVGHTWVGTKLNIFF